MDEGRKTALIKRNPSKRTIPNNDKPMFTYDMENPDRTKKRGNVLVASMTQTISGSKN